MTRTFKDDVSDVIIGFTDGLTTPFAITAGLSSTQDTHFVVLGGLCEVTAGFISMGIGAYQASRSEDAIEGNDSTSASQTESMRSGMAVGISYAVAGVIPTLPYLFTTNTITALWWSIIVTSIVLFIFGIAKGHFTKRSKIKNGFMSLIMGGLAAGAAYCVPMLIR